MAHLIDGISYVTHSDPVWRGTENHIAMVDLTPFDMANTLEQLWLKRVDEGSYVVCCIPFWAYGISLGDIVRLRGEEFVASVVKSSGRRTLRVLFPDSSEVSRLTEVVQGKIQQVDALSEWDGARYVVVDVADMVAASPLLDFLEDVVKKGLVFWEWSDAKPFRSL